MLNVYSITDYRLITDISICGYVRATTWVFCDIVP